MVAHATPDALRLFHEGSVALADISATGIRIDVDYLKSATEKVAGQIKDLKEELKKSHEYAIQRKQFGEKTNLTSRQQLGWVMNSLGYEQVGRTVNKQFTVDEAALSSMGTPYCLKFNRLAKLDKLHGTYLLGIFREVVEGLLHPNFGLSRVETFRGQSDLPNFQNIPIRDPEIAEIIRRAFIPRAGRALLEIDLQANEVRVATCYHKDPKMIRYILDGYDFHSDMADRCYLLDEGQQTKTLRFHAKNGFTFAEFYGSYYVDVARSLWERVAKEKTKDGIPLYEHRGSKGIMERGDCVKSERGKSIPPKSGSFEEHIQGLEQWMWGSEFPVYDRWRRDWYEQYKKRGWFQMLTGFVVQGIYSRNQVINSPVQGAAFHCELWGLIQLHRWLRKSRMRSQIVGHIHDSILVDADLSELDDVLAKAAQLLVVDIRKAWPFLIVPLGVEAEVAHENWYDKKPVEVPVCAV